MYQTRYQPSSLVHVFRAPKSDVDDSCVSRFSCAVVSMHPKSLIPPTPPGGHFLITLASVNPFPNIGAHVIEAIDSALC